MGAVADEEHRAMPEPLHPPAAEGIDAHPIQLELHRWAEHLPQPRQHALRPAFDVGIGIGRELEVDAEDVVRLTVQDRKSTRLNSSTNAHLVCRLMREKQK